MTNIEEAKEKIYYQWQDFLEHNVDYAGISEAYKMAIEALEKEIPKKVIVEEYAPTYCPNKCGLKLSKHHGDGYYSVEHKPKRCPECGQRLSWENCYGEWL